MYLSVFIVLIRYEDMAAGQAWDYLLLKRLSANIMAPLILKAK
jgi:hypothetical protein